MILRTYSTFSFVPYFHNNPVRFGAERTCYVLNSCTSYHHSNKTFSRLTLSNVAYSPNPYQRGNQELFIICSLFLPNALCQIKMSTSLCYMRFLRKTFRFSITITSHLETWLHNLCSNSALLRNININTLQTRVLCAVVTV